MIEHEADTIVDMVQQQWRLKPLDAARELWTAYLIPLDYEVALHAVQYLAERSKWAPSMSEYSEVYVMLNAKAGRAIAAGICPTCQGDRLVLVARRPAQATAWMIEREIKPSGSYEEFATCPDCNTTADASFRRQDGTRFVPPDPASARTMMNS